MERVELLAVDRRLECEVEVGEQLHRGEPAGTHGGLQTTVVAEADLGAEQRLDRLGRDELGSIDPGEDLIEGLQGTRHLEVGQLRSDPVTPRRRRALHLAPPMSSA